MLDFTPVRNKEMTMAELVADLGMESLRRLTNDMVNEMLAIIKDSTDADVVFVPDDPEANDTFAGSEADVDLAWTLGHLVVHVTASAEESAALAAELARGVEFHGRSRAEVPWEMVTTIEQCRERLEESRMMRLASLGMWPQNPHLDNTYEGYGGTAINPMMRFVYGLSHDDSHLAQMREVARQAKAARGA